MTIISLRPAFAVALLAAFTGPAFAHATVWPERAVAGETVEAIFGITHCDGGPTTAADGQEANDLEHPAPAMQVIGGSTVTLGPLSLAGAFTRATLPAAKVGGGYVAITNTGSEDDRLVSVASDAAERVGIHEMKMEGDTMKMGEKEDGVPLPAGETVTLAPGGLHIMFMGLKAPFIEGETVPVTLTFEKAGSVEIELAVGAVGADQAEH